MEATSGSSPIGLTAAERRTLRCVAALMIPASSAHGMPGAEDPKIFEDIVSTLGRDLDAAGRAMRHLDALAGGSFADAPASAQLSVAQLFQRAHPALAAVLVAVTTRCYYRDDRVMLAIGMEPRAPFPKGFEVAQGDWSLLEPVRARGRIYRDAPS